MDDLFLLDRFVEFENQTYQVVDLLENDLLLVVLKNDFDQQKFPFTPVIIPDIQTIEAKKKIRTRNFTNE